MEQRVAQVKALGIHQARVGVQQPEVVVPHEWRHHPLEPVRHPHVVLVAQRDQVAGAGRDGLFEVLDDPQGHGVLEDPQGDGQPGALRRAFGDRGTNDVDRAVARGIVGQHDLDRRPGLQADAAHLLAQEAGAVVGAQGDGDFEGTGVTHGWIVFSVGHAADGSRSPSDRGSGGLFHGYELQGNRSR
ncbi:hypothetical protein FQZ97_737410 [compost metagenome]